MSMVRAVAITVAATMVLVGLSAETPAAAAPCSNGVIALTFDDGPGRDTAGVLDVLAAHKAAATFFVVGSSVRAAPHLTRRTADEGHVVANHTDNHERLTALSDGQILATVGRAADAIRAAGVRPAPVVRPPYGATNTRVRQVLQSAGYAHTLWSVDTNDWRGISPEEIARRAISGFADDAVILFHDGSTRAPNTIAALPRIIETAYTRGFCLGVLDDRGHVVPAEPPPRQVAPPQQVDEIAGENRFATAVAISQAGWPAGAEEAVLVTGERYPDALSAAVLAGALAGPLLLVGEDRVDEVVLAELGRLGVRRATLIGPLSDAVEQAVREGGIATSRIRGADRYETSALIAREAVALGGGTTSTALVATGEDFADALAASALAAGLGYPILLTAGVDHPERKRVADVVAELGAERVWVIGGPATVPDEAVRGLPGLERIAGPNRAATAAAVADRAAGEGYGNDPLIASGATFPDALVGGAFAGHLRRPLLLTSPDVLSPEVHGWLAAHQSEAVTVLGGAAAVGPGPRCQLLTGMDSPDACR